MGAGWQIWKITWSEHINCQETMDALGQGQQVGLLTGKPKKKRQKRGCCS